MKEWEDSIVRDLTKYYEMNEQDKAAYRRKLMRDIENGKRMSAEIHTEKLMNRCRGLDD